MHRTQERQQQNKEEFRRIEPPRLEKRQERPISQRPVINKKPISNQGPVILNPVIVPPPSVHKEPVAENEVDSLALTNMTSDFVQLTLDTLEQNSNRHKITIFRPTEVAEIMKRFYN